MVFALAIATCAHIEYVRTCWYAYFQSAILYVLRINYAPATHKLRSLSTRFDNGTHRNTMSTLRNVKLFMSPTVATTLYVRSYVHVTI